jgi:potassium uptake TrkH family protein
MASIREIREKINLSLYKSKERNLNILKYLSLGISTFSLVIILIIAGFNTTQEIERYLLVLLRSTLFFYVLAYIVKYIYDFEPIKFFKKTWFEGILIFTLFFDGISFFLFDFPLILEIFTQLGVQNFAKFYLIFIQVYIFSIALLDISRLAKNLPELHLSPSTLFIFSFIVLIFIGAGLLMLPQMTYETNRITFFDALFTSISASCVTGLIVVDTATVFTPKGQGILMVLMQLGGLSMIVFATFFSTVAGAKFGIKQQTMIKEYFSVESLLGTSGLIRQIILISLVIELSGAILLYFNWQPGLFAGTEEKIFQSVFHSVSAFNNAGFSLFTNGLYEDVVRNNYFIHIIIAVLIFFGGIGFPAIRDMFSIQNMRTRLYYPWKTLKLSTQVALYTSVALIVVGFISFFFLEYHRTLNGYSDIEKIVISIFQSVTARTAGFNTVDFAIISQPMIIIFIFLMFIGASSGSTGGGIKTSTFTLLILAALSTIKGRRDYVIGKNKISFELMNRAFSLAFFASGIVFTGVFILSITDPNIPILQLVFEEVSAFATVGLSTGITAKLSVAGKIVLMFTMFIGRVGILTLAFSLSNEVKSNNFKYPSAHIMVG